MKKLILSVLLLGSTLTLVTTASAKGTPAHLKQQKSEEMINQSSKVKTLGDVKVKLSSGPTYDFDPDLYASTADLTAAVIELDDFICGTGV